MAVPRFNGFSLNDSNWIAERVVFKGWASRDAIRAKITRREGVALMGSEFGEKKVIIEGIVKADTATQLQTIVDNMKKAFTAEEGDLLVEENRTFHATVLSIDIPDEHYNVTRSPFTVELMCSDPFSEGDILTVVQPVTSGVFTFSGMVNISGTLFARPTVVYTPGAAAAGNTNITILSLYHVPTGQTVTVSGFGSSTNLQYQNTVTINLDDFTALENTTSIQASGAFPRFQPGDNNYTITASGRFPGGSVTVTYRPRYL